MTSLLIDLPHESQIAVVLVLGLLITIALAAIAELIERMKD